MLEGRAGWAVGCRRWGAVAVAVLAVVHWWRRVGVVRLCRMRRLGVRWRGVRVTVVTVGRRVLAVWRVPGSGRRWSVR